MEYCFAFSKTAPSCSDPNVYFFSSSVFEVCGLSEVFEFCHIFNFFLISLHCLHGLSCTFPCVLLGQLSDFLSSDCLSVYHLFWVFLCERAKSSANLKFVSFFFPLTLIPSEMSAFLKASSLTAVNSLGDNGSLCLTPLFIGNSSDINLSKWILAVAWL